MLFLLYQHYKNISDEFWVTFGDEYTPNSVGVWPPPFRQKTSFACLKWPFFFSFFLIPLVLFEDKMGKMVKLQNSPKQRIIVQFTPRV